MVTIRELIEKFGEEILDAPISFRVYDGNRNSAYTQNDRFDWNDYLLTANPDGVFFRFNVCPSGYRLVKQRS